jgi:hypothetical protein
LVSDIKGGTQTEGVWEQGAEENVWTEVRRETGEICTMRSFITCIHRQVHVIRMIKARRMKWTGHVARIEERRNAYRFWWYNQKESDY